MEPDKPAIREMILEYLEAKSTLELKECDLRMVLMRRIKTVLEKGGEFSKLPSIGILLSVYKSLEE